MLSIEFDRANSSLSRTRRKWRLYLLKASIPRQVTSQQRMRERIWALLSSLIILRVLSRGVDSSLTAIASAIASSNALEFSYRKGLTVETTYENTIFI